MSRRFTPSSRRPALDRVVGGRLTYRRTSMPVTGRVV
jgi:hypothetical protein